MATPTSTHWDGISLEILRSALLSSCEEVLAALVRSGHSPSLKERRDCSVSIYSAAGEMVVQAEHIPVHLGVMARAMRAVLAQFPPDQMSPGDCFVTNDPYEGFSNHLPDLMVSGPVFAHGELVGFVASLAHHSDVGGMAPRSMSAEATEIYQEGLRLPPVQLARGGVVDSGLMRVIACNSRTPSEIEADVQAQIAGVRLAQRRMDEIATRHDAASYRAGLDLLLERSERAMRARLRALPDGEWTGTSIAEDGANEYPIHVRVTLRGDELSIDFAGSAPQSRGPYNAALANTQATVLTVVRNLLGSDVPPNAGLYRPINMTVPEGSILHPRHPAAVAATTQVSYHTYEALMRAFEPLAPDAVIADCGAGGVFSWGGVNPRTGRLYAYGEAIGGGLGASALLDGEHAVMPPVANLRDTPTEALEMLLPVRIDRYELVRDSGGAGEHSGGMGIRRAIRMLAPATWSVQLSMSRCAPRGLHGGLEGSLTTCTLIRADGERIPIRQFTTFVAQADDVVIIETAGGAGYGSPPRSDGEQVTAVLAEAGGRAEAR
jgi:N-methylhydantoinase B